MLLGEFCLTLELALGEREIRLRDRELSTLRAVARLGCRNVRVSLGEGGLRTLHGNAIWPVVDPEQHLPAGDGRILVDEDFLHRTGDFGADRHLVRLQVGIVGAHEAAAGEVDIGADDHDGERSEGKQNPPQPKPAAHPDGGALGRRRRFGRKSFRRLLGHCLRSRSLGYRTVSAPRREGFASSRGASSRIAPCAPG